MNIQDFLVEMTEGIMKGQIDPEAEMIIGDGEKSYHLIGISQTRASAIVVNDSTGTEKLTDLNLLTLLIDGEAGIETNGLDCGCDSCVAARDRLKDLVKSAADSASDMDSGAPTPDCKVH